VFSITQLPALPVGVTGNAGPKTVGASAKITGNDPGLSGHNANVRLRRQLGIGGAAFAAAAARLESKVPQLSNGQVIVGMARMVAMLHDDETQLTLPQSPIYPFAAQWIGGGVYLVAVPAADRELLGAQLVGVDGHPVAAVLTSMATTTTCCGCRITGSRRRCATALGTDGVVPPMRDLIPALASAG
jgi:hypothetical protein